MRLLLTGGTGYIASHIAVELLGRGDEVLLLDNLSSSNADVVSRIEKITGQGVTFYEVDLLDQGAIMAIFNTEAVDAVIHLAGLKAVGESVTDPLRYYEVNISGTINLCRAVLAGRVKHFIFSSSAAVYEADTLVTEKSPIAQGASPYGRSKIYTEQILQDLVAASPQLNLALLRYFNPAGAHPSGQLGEVPGKHAGSLITSVAQVARGEREKLVIFGDDYPTSDGTCVRDYIHITDLALGHIAVLERLGTHPGLLVYNMGTGKGHTVREVVTTFEEVTGMHVPLGLGPRRAGDLATCVADPSLALAELHWHPKQGLSEICRDTWHWLAQE